MTSVVHNSNRDKQNKMEERNSRLIIESIVNPAIARYSLWGTNPAIYYEIICALTFRSRRGEKNVEFYDRFGKREIRRGRSDRFYYYYFSVCVVKFFIHYQ